MNKTSVLPEGMTLSGDIEGNEDLVVFGRVEGAIELDAALIIESGGAVRGDVRARSVTVRGILVGDAHAEEAIWVEDGARLVGDLVGPRVKVMDGARFRGHVKVLSPERPGSVVVAPRRVRPSEAPRGQGVEPKPIETKPIESKRVETPMPRAPEPKPAAVEPRPAVAAARKVPPAPTMPVLGRARARRRLAARD
jgi:cytoskeletal protein CcmA (bactofilin family)